MNLALFPAEPVALRQRRYFESSDIDDTRERISTVLQPHRLNPMRRAASIRSHMDCARLGGVVVGALHLGNEMEVILDEMGDYYLFICCLNGHAEVQSMGARTMIGQRQGVACIPGEQFSGRFSADCEQFFMRVDRAACLAHTGEALIRFDHRLDLDSPRLLPWIAQLRWLAAQPEFMSLAEQDARVAADVERLLLSLLLVGQPQAEKDIRRYTLAPAHVRRAEAWIEAHAADPIRLSDIAAAVDVPVRTLSAGFQHFLGISPMQRVRLQRLENARKALLGAERAIKVSDIALDCGFAHLGRFAQQYRQHYGESPTETLNRFRRSG
ncbi:MAG: AraC family transcriptional regulator [Zoogloeaceae bacterium]|nr:AraC family transcriptional regulator [Zoogloeaceae bacterium]